MGWRILSTSSFDCVWGITARASIILGIVCIKALSETKSKWRPRLGIFDIFDIFVGERVHRRIHGRIHGRSKDAVRVADAGYGLIAGIDMHRRRGSGDTYRRPGVSVRSLRLGRTGGSSRWLVDGVARGLRCDFHRKVMEIFIRLLLMNGDGCRLGMVHVNNVTC